MWHGACSVWHAARPMGVTEKIATLRRKSGVLVAPSGVYEASERSIGGVGAPPDRRWVMQDPSLQKAER